VVSINISVYSVLQLYGQVKFINYSYFVLYVTGLGYLHPFPTSVWYFLWEGICQFTENRTKSVVTVCFSIVREELTHCRRLTQKCVIAYSCIVDGPCISVFSYTTSNTRVYELVWHTDRFKVIVSYMQDVWISCYKQTDRSWTLF